MFENYETLTCDICEKEFTGRRPVKGANILCAECQALDELPVVGENDELPDSVVENYAEGGKGDE